MRNLLSRLTFLIAAVVMAAEPGLGAVQYWDSSATAGYQHGDGPWSTAAGATNWTTAGIGPLSPWVNTNDAVFPARGGGSSTVTLNTSLTSSAVTVTGSLYSIIITNGGRLSSGVVAIGGGRAANGNLASVLGGAGVTSFWAATTMNVGGGTTTTFPGASNNTLIVDGKGVSGSAIVTNSGTLDVGAQANCVSNEVQVIAGGRLFTSGTAATDYGFGNTIRILGVGSIWNVGGAELNVAKQANAYSHSLIIDDGAVVTNSGNLWVGRANGVFNNEARVSGGGSLYVAQVNVANSAGGTGNVIRVTGANSLLNASGAITVGYAAAQQNSLIVENGAVLTNASTLVVGNNVAAAGNEVQILGGSRYYSGGSATIGSASGTGNVVRVQGTNSLWDAAGKAVTVGSGAGAQLNMLVVSDSGSVSNAGALTVGSSGPYNSLIISNRASLSSAGLTIGLTSSSNTVALKDNSILDLRNGLLVWGSGAVTNNTFTGDASSALTNAGGLSLNDAGRTVYLTNQMLNGMKIAFSGGALNIGTSPNLAPPSLVMSNFTLNPMGGSGGASIIGSTCSNSTASILSGSLWNGGGQALTVGSGAMATNNTLLIDGQGVVGGAVVTNVAVVTVGTLAKSGGNMLRIANGGKLFSTGVPVIGLTSSSNNTVWVTGTGSQWQISGAATLGSGAGDCTGNVLRVENGGVVSCSGAFSFSAPSSSLIIRGGRVYGGITCNLDKPNSLVSVIGGEGLTSLLDGQNSGMLVYYSSNSFIIDGNGYEGSAIATNVSSTKLGTDNFACSGSMLIVTNKGRLYTGSVYVGTGIGNARCGLSLTTGGKLYSTGAMIIGGNAGSTTDNVAMVSGDGSLWNAGTQTLTIGNAAATSMGNSLTITQTGTVDNLGTLTVAGISNSVNLLGGMLGVINTTYTNGLFTVGDGVQAATLKSLPGGTLAFTAGLRINTNSTLTGLGIVNGAGTGVLAGDGATLAPGSNGVGTLTIGGSNLTLGAGSVYRCEIADLNPGPGVGWDVVNVSSQLVLAAGAVIKMDSMNALAANFDAGRNYNLRIANYGSLAGVNPATLTVNADDFQNGGTWTLTNAANALWLIYRGAGAPGAADYTWNAPANGNWDAGVNWAGASAPADAGGASLKVAFGDTGVAYRSTNNLGGVFQLNQLRFSSSSGVTNFLLGNQIALTNTGARVDYLAGETGLFVVSNVVSFTTDTELGGEAFGGTLSLAGPVTNLGTLTKRGTWTLALGSGYNNLSGPVVVDGPDGTLRVDQISALSGYGPVTVSNGQLVVATATHIFSSARNNRRALVKGSGSTWTNNAAFTVSDGATNVQLVVDGGSFHAPTLLMFINGSRDGSIIVTNGGALVNRSNTSAVGNNSTNCLLQVTGATSTMNRNQAMSAGAGSGSGNRIVIEKGARAWGSTAFNLSAGGVSNTVQVSEGAIVSAGGANAPAMGGLNVLGSNSAVLVTGSGSLVSLSSSGNGSCCVGIGSDYGNTMTIASNAVVTNLNLQMALGWASQNQLIVTNGARLYAWAASQVIANGTGTTANVVGNTATITGPNSLWDLKGNALTICQSTGSLNQLLVQNDGLVTNVGTLLVASGAGAQGNNVTVSGGVLQASMLTWSNTLPNSFTLTGLGQVSLAAMVATNANQMFAFNGGTLSIRNSLVSTGGVFVAGNGSQAAQLNFVPGGTNIFVDTLAITNNATLAGSGLIQATTTVYGVLSPGGVGLGSVTNNGLFTLTNGATARFELAANTTPGAGWDLLAVTNGALNLGGTLVPVLKSGFLPVQSDRFLIMTNQGPSTVSGDFANGSRATIYAENLTTKLGTFKIEKGTQGVVLTDYQILRSSGTLIFVR